MTKTERINTITVAARLEEIQNNLADAERLIEAQKLAVYQIISELLESMKQ